VQTRLDNGTWTSLTYDDAGRTTRAFHRKSAGTVISK
jgi:YD repeat-containing protein